MNTLEAIRLRSIADYPNYSVDSEGNVYGPKGVLKPNLNSRGYCNVSLVNRPHGVRKVKSHSIHRLVAAAFMERPSECAEVNHKNGNKADNSLANLELATPSENTRHAFTHLGRKPVKNPSPGQRNGRAKLSEADIPAIFAARALGLSQQKIAEKFGVSQVSISRVLLGKSFRIS